MLLLVYPLIAAFGMLILLGVGIFALVLSATLKSINERRAKRGEKTLSELKVGDVVEAIGSSHPEEPIIQGIAKNLPSWFGTLVKTLLALGGISGIGYLAYTLYLGSLEGTGMMLLKSEDYISVREEHNMRFAYWVSMSPITREITYDFEFEPGKIFFPENLCVKLIPARMAGKTVALTLVKGGYIYEETDYTDAYLKFLGPMDAFREKEDGDVCSPILVDSTTTDAPKPRRAIVNQ